MRTVCIIGFCLFAFTACKTEKVDDSKVLAISWYYPQSDYQRWVNTQDSSYSFVELYTLEPSKIDSVLESVDGIILTGGPDIQPRHYGTVDSLSVCGEPNTLRDSIELLSSEFAKERGTPILGVCRGMQIMNVSLGGNLYLDIPSDLNSDAHKVDETDAEHFVYGTSERFKTVFGVGSGWTNSNHHQSLRVIGAGLEVDGMSIDSVIEAISLADSLSHPFFKAVQWHPERMERDSPMAANVLREFLKAVNNE